MKRKMTLPHKTMTEEKFQQVKTLTNLNLSNRQIQAIIKISGGTVCAIKRVPDFATYKADQKAYFEAKKAKKFEPVSDEPIASERIETPIYDVLIEIRNKITETNYLLAQAGKSKGFKLF